MLQFVDDTIFFCEDNVKNIITIKCVMRCFEIVCGLKVNFRKSRIEGISIQNTEIQRYFVILNCNQMDVPFKYLGVLMGDNHRKKILWNDMILKIKNKLTTWKGKHLSFADIVTLVKSVQSSVPLYYLSLFRIPSAFGKIITRIQRDFLWGWGSDRRKVAW